MKVLHVLSSNKFSGAENVVCQIIKMFKGEVEMAYCSPNGEIKKTLENMNIQFFPLEKLNVKNLKKVVAEFKPDIIHAHDIRACTVASRIKKIKKIAHIHCNHEKMRKYSLRSFIAKHVLNKFSKVIWVSKESEREFIFKNSIRNKSMVLENIVSLEDINLRKEKAKLTQGYDVVYCGRLVELKNPLRILDIAKLLDKSVKIGIIGNGELEPVMREKINKFNLVDRVELLGFVDIPFKIIENSKVMLMTSKTEGTPMSALESLCLKTPIISTAVGGMNDLIIDNKNGFLYNTNEEAAKIITNLLNNEKHLQDLKQKTYEFAKKYNDCDKWKNKIRKVYEER